MQLGDSGFKAWGPISIRHMIGLIPKSVNPFFGIRHISNKSSISDFERWNTDQRQNFVFNILRRNVVEAFASIPFYHDFYEKNGFHPSHLRTFEDIRKIPVINKSILLEYPIEQRSLKTKGALRVNTGGSSGKTLAFYRDPSREYHEGIHMTTIWEKIGYRHSDLKLIMAGQNTVQGGVDFCFQSNSVRIDMYKEFSQLSPKLIAIAERSPIRYLHGYPSLFYEFALYCDEHDHQLRDILRKTLKGAFLGSEYPHLRFRDKIEGVFNIETVNWYGHTEGAVLAYEKNEKFRYSPFHTYGFTEASDEGHLIASTYYNRAAPFIRYDTEDIISDTEVKNGFLMSFGIKDGRNGEFITDRNGKKISLTGLIFGRHHKLFDFCSHIQICEKEPGKAVILYLPKVKNADMTPDTLFDSSNIEVEFSFREVDLPVKTKSGKLNLLVKPDQLKEL